MFTYIYEYAILYIGRKKKGYKSINNYMKYKIKEDVKTTGGKVADKFMQKLTNLPPDKKRTLETEVENILEEENDTLEKIAEMEDAYEGVLDDDYEDAFNRWLENNTTIELLQKLIDYLKDN